MQNWFKKYKIPSSIRKQILLVEGSLHRTLQRLIRKNSQPESKIQSF